MCTSLGIACKGYGSKPSWMDRGPLEREEANRIKEAIARSRPKKRRSRFDSISSASSYRPAVDADSSGQSDVASTGAFEATTTQAYEDNQEIFPDLASHMEDLSREGQSENSASHEAFWLDGDLPDVSGEEYAAEASGIPLPDVFSPMDLPSDSYDVPGSGFGFGNFASNGDDLSALPQFGEVSAMALLGPDDGTHIDPGVSISTLEQGRSQSEPSTMFEISLKPAARFWSRSSGSTDSWSTCSSGTSAGLGHLHHALASGGIPLESALNLSYYIDSVLPAQFPFSYTHNRSGSRQWLQFLLFSSRPIFDISAVLGKLHRNVAEAAVKGEARSLFTCKDEMDQVMGILRKLPSSAATLSRLDEWQKMTESIVACTALLQVIYIEMSYSNSVHWENCLAEATPYMQTLIDLAVRTPDSRLASDSNPNIVSEMQRNAAKALLGHLIWFDLLATASTAAGPYLGTDHGYLLNLDSIPIKEASGCQGWVAKSLFNIIVLQGWKMQAEQAGKLSIIELASRGAAILEEMNGFCTQLHDGSIKGCHDAEVGDKRSCVLDQWHHEVEKHITLAFAHAAIIYLHVVISGPNPHLEEIRREVPELIKSFKVLNAKEMVDYVAWPLCVAACFAEPEELQAILQLHVVQTDARCSRNGHLRACTEALEIARECRRIREEEGKICDWTLAMKQLQKHVMLG
ncbi:fungal-specific transcription factor domain-containing protein [Trichoderma ceciliae]